jgi:hypothetical protein
MTESSIQNFALNNKKEIIMDNVHKVNNFVNIPSSEVFIPYWQRLRIITNFKLDFDFFKIIEC